IEVRVDDGEQTVCAGRRESTGGWSLYLTPDRVYHFDAEGRLRRAYVEGFLYRSEGETLSRLRRERSAAETSLLRADLEPEELTAFLAVMRAQIEAFVTAIDGNRVQTLRASSGAESVLVQLKVALELALRSRSPLAPALRG
ncbi:MAG TPA: hypothetical protein VM510_11910, partial [Caulifigura sp.]|nr:hypothetical protein [Caulifigura sp.]